MQRPTPLDAPTLALLACLGLGPACSEGSGRDTDSSLATLTNAAPAWWLDHIAPGYK